MDITTNANTTLTLNNYTVIDNISTEWTPPDPPHEEWLIALLATMAGIVSVCTTIGNIMVVISFIMEKSIRQPANYLIASLAVTDIIIGGSSMPLYTVYLLKNYWPLGDLTCDLWLSLDYTVCLVSQYTVFLITLDRYCSVTVATTYRSWRTPFKMKIMIAATWVVPAIIFFASIMGWHHFNADSRDSHQCIAMFQESPLFSAILVICYYWVTLIIMIVLYIGIYRVALNIQKRTKATKKRIQEAHKLAANTAAREKEKLLNSTCEMNKGLSLSTPASSESSNGGSQSQQEKVDKTANSVGELINSNEQQTTNNSPNQLIPPTIRVETCQKSAEPPQYLAVTNNTSDKHDKLETPTSTCNAESPIWKPRSSLPNSSIHWDAITGQTYVTMEKVENNNKPKEKSQFDMLGSASPSPQLASKRYAKQRKHSDQSRSRSDYNDDETNSETSESESKPKGLSGISSLMTSIIPASPKPKRKNKVSIKKRKQNRARKALRTISFILGAFVICWTPYHVIVLVDSFCESCYINDTLYKFSYWLCYMNSPLNPFCYALANPQFKKSFLRILNLTYLRNCWQKIRQH